MLSVKPVRDCVVAERAILAAFNERFVQKRDYGVEYFQGPVDAMVALFDEVATSFLSTTRTWTDTETADDDANTERVRWTPAVPDPLDLSPPGDGPTIDLDLVATWFDVRKSNLKTTLKTSHRLGVDYTVEKNAISQPGRGKNTHRIVKLTPDCFKKLCLESRSPNGASARKYFSAKDDACRKRAAEEMQRIMQDGILTLSMPGSVP